MPTNKKKNKKAERLNKVAQKPNGRRLAKALPDIAKRIEEASKHHSYDPNALKKACNDIVGEIIQEQKIRADDEGMHQAGIDGTVQVLTELAAPGATEDAKALQKVLSFEFQWYFAEKREGSTDYIMGKLQGCLNDVITKYQHYIVPLCFQGDNQAQQESWNTLKQLTPNEFGLFLMKEVSKREDSTDGLIGQLGKMSDNISNSVKEIAQGIHRNCPCWTCGKEAKHHCTKCGLAMYCSKECQTAQWKPLHKKVCKETKHFSDLFTKNMAIVDEALDNPQAHKEKYGMAPSTGDYHIVVTEIAASLMFRQETLEMCDLEPISGPDMSFFYSNLQQVLDGKLWYQASQGHVDEQSIPFFSNGIGGSLMYDYSKLKNTSVAEYFETMVVMVSFTPDVLSLSSDQWCSLYKKQAHTLTQNQVHRRHVAKEKAIRKFNEGARDMFAGKFAQDTLERLEG